MSDYFLHSSGYVYRNSMAGQKIVGRISGYGPGSWWYQIAARPYDEKSVTGFKDEQSALDAMERELNRRSNQETIQEARAS